MEREFERLGRSWNGLPHPAALASVANRRLTPSGEGTPADSTNTTFLPLRCDPPVELRRSQFVARLILARFMEDADLTPKCMM